MWFYLGCRNFVAKKSCNDNFCDLFISDFVSIWYKSLSDNELIAISQKLNPLLEVSVHKLRDLTLNLLEDGEARKEIKKEGSNIALKIESSIFGLKFTFQVSLNLGDNELFYKEFTLPLLKVVLNKHVKEKNLIKIIEDKDIEITEYKQEFGQIKSSYMTTKPFNEKEFDCQGPATSIQWDLSSFLDCVATKILSNGNSTNNELQPAHKEEDHKSKIKKCDKRQLLFKDTHLNQQNYSKPCVSLDNQIIKKKRNHAKVPKLGI